MSEGRISIFEQKEEKMEKLYEKKIKKTGSVHISTSGTLSRNRCCFGKAILGTVCFCSLRYPACNVHAPYCRLWPMQL